MQDWVVLDLQLVQSVYPCQQRIGANPTFELGNQREENLEVLLGQSFYNVLLVIGKEEEAVAGSSVVALVSFSELVVCFEDLVFV